MTCNNNNNKPQGESVCRDCDDDNSRTSSRSSSGCNKGECKDEGRDLPRQHLSLVRGFGGMLAGLTSTIILQPFDVVKVRMQVSGTKTQSSHNYRNSLHAFRSLVKNEGITALYKVHLCLWFHLLLVFFNIGSRFSSVLIWLQLYNQGSAPNILGNALAWGTYMLGYDFIKTLMTEEGDNLHPAQHLASGIIAGNIALFAVNPVWVVKTRMILQTKSDATQYKSMRHAFQTIWRTEGLNGFYRGIFPGMLGTAHGGLQFMVYEALKKKFKKTPTQQKLETIDYLIAATLSKWFAGIITYPYQVVRSREQMRGNTLSALSIFKNTWREFGLRGFFKGVGPYLLRTVPATCIVFVAYENITLFLESKMRSI
eukprot:m.46905 g.46905  ORF g.46905 m.46905 type:complete len:369 (+) comp10736_c0_seq1:126-1232(+)